jgi:23S rRNA pseudouridine1911/1915/1917 synthase
MTGFVERLQVEDVGKGQRLDRYLADHIPSLSRSQAQRLIDELAVTVDGARAKAGHRLRGGEIILASLPHEDPVELTAEYLPLSLTYEDDVLLVVDKPAGMVVHPAPGHEGGTLVNALLAHRPGLVSLDRAGIVHRLDRYTSGLLLVAKTAGVHKALQRQFRERKVHKVYLALVSGQAVPREGRIEAPLGRDPSHRQRMAVVASGRPAFTTYQVREYFEQHSLLEVQPETGRTHQIRVHLAAIGHPIAGDRQYGRRSDPLGVRRCFLHAWRLGFTHPTKDEWLEVETSLPPELVEVLAQLRRA